MTWPSIDPALHGGVVLQALHQRRGDGLFVVRLDGEQQPLAAGGDGQLVVGEHGHPLAQVRDEFLAEIDVRPVGVVVHAFQDLLPDAFFALAEEFVEQRSEVVEGVEDIDVEGRVGGDVARHPGLRREVVGVGQLEHLHRVLVGRRGIDGRPMDHLVAVGGKIDESAHALDGAEALVANHFHDGLSAAAFFGGRGGPGGLGIAQGKEEPADLVAARLARPRPQQRFITAVNPGSCARLSGFGPSARRPRMPRTTSTLSAAINRFPARA